MQDIGEKEKIDMKKKTTYTNAPENISASLISGEKVYDFLPPPGSAHQEESKNKSYNYLK